MATKSRVIRSLSNVEPKAGPATPTIAPVEVERRDEEGETLSPFEQALLGAIKRTRRKSAERDEAA
jgi:hypothetical protein